MTKTITLFLVAFMAVGAGLAFAEERSVDREARDGDFAEDSEAEDWGVAEESVADDREADDQEVAEDGEAEDRDGLTGDLYRLSDIESFDVVSHADDDIGNVDEAVLTLEGMVTHLIVDLRDVDGLEDGTYTVPLDSIRVFDNNMSLDLRRMSEFYSYEGDSDSERARLLPEGSVTSSDLRGYDVVGQNNDQIANMEDLVVDMGTGQVVYVAIASGGFLGIDQDYHAISFDLIDVDVADQRVRIDVTDQEFENLESFDLGQWPLEGRSRTATATTMLDTAQQSE